MASASQSFHTWTELPLPNDVTKPCRRMSASKHTGPKVISTTYQRATLTRNNCLQDLGMPPLINHLITVTKHSHWLFNTAFAFPHPLPFFILTISSTSSISEHFFTFKNLSTLSKCLSVDTRHHTTPSINIPLETVLCSLCHRRGRLPVTITAIVLPRLVRPLEIQS